MFDGLFVPVFVAAPQVLNVTDEGFRRGMRPVRVSIADQRVSAMEGFTDEMFVERDEWTSGVSMVAWERSGTQRKEGRLCMGSNDRVERR